MNEPDVPVPVTTPVDGSTVPFDVLELLHAPPLCEAVSVISWPAPLQTLSGPLMAPPLLGSTVTTDVAEQDPTV